ncbi:MAG: tol-pal system YbgF family protein [Candidatus Thorarchaeota archaeon]
MIYGFFSIFVNIYYFLSEKLRTKSEKISIEQQVKDVEHDLDTVKQEIDAGNYRDAISRLNNLESNLLLTPEGKKRMRSLLAQCYFQQKDYPDAYYNLKLLARKSQLTINDYLRKIQCEFQLNLPQQRHQTLEEALGNFPGHPELKALIIEEDR